MNKNNSNRHILVVDDEPILRVLLRTYLESIGHLVSTAENGLEALHLVAEKDFDIIFMDLRMPVMDGLTATKLIRQCEQRQHLSLTEHHELGLHLQRQRKGLRIPIVAITGNVDDNEIALQAGMDEFIQKPFNLSKIYDTIGQLCGKSRTNNPTEKRRHPRHVIKIDTVTIGTTGEVVDISNSGLAIKYANYESIPNEWKATIVNKTKSISTSYLPLKLIRKGVMALPSPSGVKMQIIGVMFHNLDTSQQDQIDQFIARVS